MIKSPEVVWESYFFLNEQSKCKVIAQQLNSSEIIWINVKINLKIYNVMIDTGSQYNYMSREIFTFLKSDNYIRIASESIYGKDVDVCHCCKS